MRLWHDHSTPLEDVFNMYMEEQKHIKAVKKNCFKWDSKTFFAQPLNLQTWNSYSTLLEGVSHTWKKDMLMIIGKKHICIKGLYQVHGEKTSCMFPTLFWWIVQ